jgi:hypothetical protein
MGMGMPVRSISQAMTDSLRSSMALRLSRRGAKGPDKLAGSSGDQIAHHAVQVFLATPESRLAGCVADAVRDENLAGYVGFDGYNVVEVDSSSPCGADKLGHRCGFLR